MEKLNTPIKNLAGVGSKVAERLDKLKIKTVGGLLQHFPHRHEDFSHVKNIGDLLIEEKATIIAKVTKISTARVWARKLTITTATLEDETASIKAVWFNQPYIEDIIKKDIWISFSGNTKADKKGVHFSNPIFELLGESKDEIDNLIHTGGLVPIYPETRGLTSRWLRTRIKALLDQTEEFEDFLPESIVKKYKLSSYDSALRAIHFPKSDTDIRSAKKRLAFGELFLLGLYGAIEKQKIKSSPAPAIATNLALTKKLIASLPYTLTNSQRLATWQILQDIASPQPMNRLLEGDVGSGKTVVATIAALNTKDAGLQTAIMAPTEILAHQHFASISQTLAKSDVKVALLTSKESKLGKEKISKKKLQEKIAKGNVDIVIGTHSLVQKGLEFKKLGLLVLDEQHRFGVKQRAYLLKNNESPKSSASGQAGIRDKDKKEKPMIHDSKFMIPHLLSMTATPIPRTLALAVYGDLDISLLREMPKGRKKIITKSVSPNNRQKAYQFIREQIKKGRQAFVICPLVEESDKLTALSAGRQVKSVQQEYKKLNNGIFPDIPIAMLHGRLKQKEKESIMDSFRSGKSKILISTAVVEVGVDVPNASVMMIEGSDRFGLAQLHQFRGRVGRAQHQSYCFLFTDSPSVSTKARLDALVKSSDGFALAEHDLELRGPGQFFGTRQSGLPDLAMASLQDAKLIEETQVAVKYFIDNSSLDEHPALKEKLDSFTEKIHWE